MSIRTRITSVGKDITAVLNDAISPRAQSAALAAQARVELKKGQDQNRRALGRVPSHTTTVDSRLEAELESVKPDGVIVFEFELLGGVLDWIADKLETKSPYRTGEFSQSHTLFADGVETNVQKPDPASEYVFMSVDKPGKVRALESGHSRQAPAGVYEVVATMAHRRFNNQASIYYTFRNPYQTSFRHLSGKARRQAEKDVRVPAIVVVAR